MARYQLDAVVTDSADADFSAALARVHGTAVRPLCMCRNPGVEMYVAKINGGFFIKRMPSTGGNHAASCESYEPPPELSGLGQVAGSAIQEDPDSGTTALKFDFSLSKAAGRAAPTPSGKEPDSVKTDGNKLSLRGTLHYLWEEAGFNRWAPKMAGRRSWSVIRKYLLQSASDKTAKGTSLAELMYMPEPFAAEHKDAIAQRRLAQLGKCAAAEKGARRLMLVIGDVKEFAVARYGHKVVLKHAPDFHLMLADDIYKRIFKRFAVELELWNLLDVSHLVLIGTMSIGPTGVASLEEAALMCVSENWIPFESTADKMVLDALTAQGLRFMKGMRYNLSSTRPLACAVATDTVPHPTAMYVLPVSASEDYIATMDALIAESSLASWVWRVGDEPMPALPCPA